MARVPLLNFRVDDDTKARWQAAADHAGVTLSEYVRDAVEFVIAENLPHPPSRLAARPPARPPVEAVGISLESDRGRVSPEVLGTSPSGGKVFRGPDPKPEPRQKGRR